MIQCFSEVAHVGLGGRAAGSAGAQTRVGAATR